VLASKVRVLPGKPPVDRVLCHGGTRSGDRAGGGTATIAVVTVVAGVDACRGGWVAIALDRGQFSTAVFATSFPDLLARCIRAEAIGVDIPIGVPDEGLRAADVAARAFVGPRRGSVFPTPPRAALAAGSYAEARSIVPSLSAQSFAIGRKIIEVEACLDDERVFEVHPEVSFATLAGHHLRHSKRSWNGQMERRQLLEVAGIILPNELPIGDVAADDILDAAAASWTAARKATGKAATLPLEPPIRGGRVVAIWR